MKGGGYECFRVVAPPLIVLFLFFLLSLSLEPLQASTTGAGGSGKPLLVKMRKDLFEKIILNKLNENLGTIPLDSQGLVTAKLVATDVLLGRETFSRIKEFYVAEDILFPSEINDEPLNEKNQMLIFIKFSDISSGSLEIDRYYNDFFKTFSYSPMYGSLNYDENAPTMFVTAALMLMPDTNDPSKKIWRTILLHLQITDLLDMLAPMTNLESVIFSSLANKDIPCVDLISMNQSFPVQGLTIESGNAELAISPPSSFALESQGIAANVTVGTEPIAYDSAPILPAGSYEEIQQAGTLEEIHFSNDIFTRIFSEKLNNAVNDSGAPIRIEDGREGVFFKFYRNENTPSGGYLGFDLHVDGTLCIASFDILFNISKDSDGSLKMVKSDCVWQINNLGCEILYDIIAGFIPGSTDACDLIDSVANSSLTIDISSLATTFINKVVNEGYERVIYTYRVEIVPGFNFFSDVVNDLVLDIQGQNPFSPNYASAPYYARWNWMFADNDQDGWINIDDVCPFSRDNAICDRDGDFLRDDVDEKVYYTVADLYPSKRDETPANKQCSLASGEWGFLRLCHYDVTVHHNETIKIDSSIGLKETWNGDPTDQTYLSSYHCYCGSDDLSRQDCNPSGACGLNHAKPNEIRNGDYSNQLSWQPVNRAPNRLYTDTPCEGSGSILPYRKRNAITGTCAADSSVAWEWQEDLAIIYNVTSIAEWDDVNRLSLYGGRTQKEYFTEVDPIFHAARFSHGPARTFEQSAYTVGFGSDEKINPSYFENSRVTGDEVIDYNILNSNFMPNWASSKAEMVYLMKWFTQEPRNTVAGKFNHWHYPHELMHDLIYPGLLDPSGPVSEPGFLTPDYFYRASLVADHLQLSKNPVQPGRQAIVATASGPAVYYWKESSHFLSPAHSGAYETVGKPIRNGVDMRYASSAQKSGVLYAAGSLVRSMEPSIDDDPFASYNFAPIFGKIVDEGNNFNYISLASIPANGIRTLRLGTMNMTLYVLTYGSNNHLAVFSYDENGDVWNMRSTTI
ncbi:MAG TPA: hypothetical protein PKH10_07690, partial [bacterium]|nr:hypothetical protein [bacterium]